ncbi:MAG TPA: hypothetical protein VF211_12120 [Burkholderiales bacterium]
MAPVVRSDEELLEYLEQLSGRSIRTRADLEAYLNELKARAAPPAPRARFWALAKHASLGVGLLIAVLQYYLIDVYLQIETLQRVQFLSPVAPVLRTSLLQLPGFLS